MKYQDLRKNGETISHTSKIEVIECDGVAYKIFDKSFSHTLVYYEAMLQTMAHEQGVRVPKIYGVERVDDSLAILSEYIEGQTVQELMEENPAKKDYYLDILVDTQLKINSHIVWDIARFKDKISREIKTLSYIDDIKRYELEIRLASMPNHSKLCHGNFGPENVMIDGMDNVIVLDWVAASRGNAGADVAKAYLKLTLISTELAERYITLFCRKFGCDRQYVYEWLPLIAACGLGEKNISEREKAVMLSWLDVVDHD